MIGYLSENIPENLPEACLEPSKRHLSTSPAARGQSFSPVLRPWRLRRRSRWRHVMAMTALTALTPWRGSQVEGSSADFLSFQCFVALCMSNLVASLLVAVHAPGVAAVLAQSHNSHNNSPRWSATSSEQQIRCKSDAEHNMPRDA